MTTQLERAVNKIVDKSLPDKPLGPHPAAQDIPASRGTGTPAATQSGSGISSPLTEGSYAARTYYTATVTSTDGLFSFQALHTIDLTDASGSPVQIIFATPP